MEKQTELRLACLQIALSIQPQAEILDMEKVYKLAHSMCEFACYDACCKTPKVMCKCGKTAAEDGSCDGSHNKEGVRID